jgi:hypothetical protein
VKRSIFLQISAVCLTAAFVSVGAGCGGSGTKEPPGITIRGVVLYANDAAIANPNGAEGLVPTGADVKIDVEYNVNADVTSNVLPPAITDAQGHFQLTGAQPDNLYFFGIPDHCSTATILSFHQVSHIITTHSVGYHSGYQPSGAMITKGDAAAKALGVDVVVLVGTDADACH